MNYDQLLKFVMIYMSCILFVLLVLLIIKFVKFVFEKNKNGLNSQLLVKQSKGNALIFAKKVEGAKEVK